jgi:hypothetical protein
MISPNVEEKEKFSKKIISLVEQDNISYIEAITEYSEAIGLEIDIAAKLITPSIVAKIAEEAMRDNLIEKHPVLPF